MPRESFGTTYLRRERYSLPALSGVLAVKEDGRLADDENLIVIHGNLSENRGRQHTYQCTLFREHYMWEALLYGRLYGGGNHKAMTCEPFSSEQVERSRNKRSKPV